MLQKDLIKKFLESKSVAIIGVSRKKDIPANAIFDKFKKAGYNVYPVNPNASEIDGITCYENIKALPEKPEAVLLAGPPSVSEAVVKECIDIGVKNIWMHRGMGKGSYSKKAESDCNENGIQAITNGCPMMFISPVDPFHKVFRWFK
jgi:uncharacterized protein